MTVTPDLPPTPAFAATDDDHDFPGDRSGTWLGVAAGLLGGGGLLYFWIMGAIGLVTLTGGTMNQLELTGFWRDAYWTYPFVFIGATVAGGALLAIERDREAVGVFSLPLAAAVAYYLALIYLRPV
jgi:hypothetical protein